MFERYTENARNVLNRASQEAQKMHHDHIGTEHILLGLIEVKAGVAAKVFEHRNLDLPHAIEQVALLAQNGPEAEGHDCEVLPRTVHAQSLLDDAVQEARALKHNYIGTEHILLGLLHENEGTGAQVIRNLGFKLDDIRQDVLHLFDRDDTLKAEHS